MHFIFWHHMIARKPDPRLPDILCSGTREECLSVLPFAILAAQGPGYCIGDYSPLPQRRRRSPESLAASRRKAIEKRAAAVGGLFHDEILERMLAENADRLDPEKIREKQEADERLYALDTAPEAAMSASEAVGFLRRLPCPFVCDWVDVWEEYRRTRQWTPRMRGFIENIKSPECQARQERIKTAILIGKEKSEGELLKMLKL